MKTETGQLYECSYCEASGLRNGFCTPYAAGIVCTRYSVQGNWGSRKRHHPIFGRLKLRGIRPVKSYKDNGPMSYKKFLETIPSPEAAAVAG